MKKITSFLIALVLIFTCTAGYASAAVVTASLDVEDYYVEINAKNLTAYQRALIVAVPAGKSAYDVLSDGTAAYFEQTEVGKTGIIDKRVMFSSLAMPEKYEIHILCGSDVYKSESFQYLKESLAAPAINAVNSASASSMYSALSGADTSLALDFTEYSALSVANQKKVASLMHSLRPSGGFADIKAIHTAFGAAVATVSSPVSASPSAVITKYAENLSLDITSLAECTSAEKSEFDKYIKTKSFSTPDDVKSILDEAVFVAKVHCSSTAGEIQNLFMNTYKTKLTLDMTTYNDLISTVSVFSYLYNNRASISGFADASSKFNSFAQSELLAQGRTEQKGTSSPTGGFPAVSSGTSQNTQPNQNENTSPSNYTDLADYKWAQDSIELLTQKGVLSGDGNGKFRPGDTVTRAEFLKMIVLAFDIPADGENIPFEDVSENSWYSQYVSAGVKYGIVKGVTAVSFEPDSIITRQDIALICKRAAEMKALQLIPVRTSLPADFSEVSDYASAAVNTLYQSAIINGYEDGSFKPLNSASRAEAVKIIAALISYGKGVN